MRPDRAENERILSYADVFLPGGVLRIDKYDDRLVLRNPGTLRLPVEKIYEGGTSRARNPHIQNMLRMIGYGENLGSGFPMIVSAWKDAGWGEPKLENRIDIDEVALILPVQTKVNDAEKHNETTQKTTQKIMEMMKTNTEISIKELAVACGITRDGVNYHIRNLKKNNKIRRIGGDKGGHWEIIEDAKS